jgi:hypothetical protein
MEMKNKGCQSSTDLNHHLYQKRKDQCLASKQIILNNIKKATQLNEMPYIAGPVKQFFLESITSLQYFHITFEMAGYYF